LTSSSADAYQTLVRRILDLLRERRADEAEKTSLALLESHPGSNDALLLLGKARQLQGRFDEMLQLVEAALGREPENTSLQLQYAGACHFCGQHDKALRQYRDIETRAGENAALLQTVAESYAHAGRHEDAHRCYLRITRLAGDDPRFLYNLASSLVAVGDLERAEETYSRVIERRPDYYEAWYSRSTLRKQTPDDNHIDTAEALLEQLAPEDTGVAWLCYTLAKEYEDLGDDERSFSCLERGARIRHRELSYDVRADVAGMQRISKLFGRRYAASAKSAGATDGPIFVLGLPRSGTTLVDRILSSHSQVESMGELTDFALTLTRLSGTVDPRRLLDAYAGIEPERLGQEYRRSVASYGPGAAYFIDKMPTNFLYVGLITKALPGAPVIHVERHPVDSCLAMYRTMFRNGYPFSYDLDSLADYYIAYRALMNHWRTAFPGSLHDVSYEQLVAGQERVSREIVERCGLAWEPACLAFDRNAAPVMTASAAQVRKPLYSEASGRWRRFERQLEPLIARLDKAGVPL
jgi:tetratricopeptide (TPR) repeat protein